MSIRLNVTKCILSAVMLLTTCSAMSQDKLASIAPIDKKMRAIDSVAIKRLFRQNEVLDMQMPASALYPSWDNTYTRSYGVALPAEYRIDLRDFCMPAESRLVTSSYGYRRSFRRMHYGTDIKVYVGDTIRAAFPGKIRIVAYEGKGYGQYVIIRHPNGLETVYAHMSKQLVQENQIVKAGEAIGLGGNTGRSTGSHLHFETRFLGQFIDPELLFDFEARDVKGDFYMFRSGGNGTMLATRNVVGGESEISEEIDRQLAKAEESREFQENKIAAQRSKPRSQVHKVKPGETLSAIANKYGTTVDRLCKLNKLSKRSTLRLGQIIKYS